MTNQIKINTERLGEIQGRSQSVASRRGPIAQRLAAKLKADGECLVWTGHRTDQG